MDAESDEPSISGEEIQERVEQLLAKYANLNFLERFAMFTGTAQIFEIRLKSLLARKYGYDIDDLERWTIGRAARELKDLGL